MAAGAASNRLEKLWLRGFSAVLGALPDHVGQFRLASAYLRRRPPAHEVIVQPMRGGLRAALDVGDRTQGIAYLIRRYEPELLDFIGAHLPSEGVFVDVGAHVGLVSLEIAHRRPDVHVFAFEPCEPNAEAWQRNRDLNRLDNAELFRSAIADRVGTQAFHVASESAAGYLANDGTERVEVTTLDEFARARGLSRIHVLKLDIEGGEAAALDGAGELLAAGIIDLIVCEFNAPRLAQQRQRPSDITAILHNAGFSQTPIPSGRRLVRPPAAITVDAIDIAFTRNTDVPAALKDVS